LVAAGKSRDEIAGLFGVTVNSLQVTCSKLGISLRRRPKLNPESNLPRHEILLRGTQQNEVARLPPYAPAPLARAEPVAFSPLSLESPHSSSPRTPLPDGLRCQRTGRRGGR
jgi:hypothetical protein